MTLILNCLTHDYAVQVSDRRLTALRNGDVLDSNSNKAVIFDGRVAFAYTGLASMGPSDTDRTDRWLTTTLADNATARWPEAIANAAAARLNLLTKTPARWKRLAFVVAGWGRTDAHAPMAPLWGVISNFGDFWSWLTEPNSDFTYQVGYLPADEPFRIYSAGHPIHKGEWMTLRRRVRACAERGLGPEPVVRLFKEQIRAVAMRTQAVGRSLMVSSIPKDSIPVQMVLRVGQPDFSKATFLYVPADCDNAVYYAPNYAVRGIAAVDFTAERNHLNSGEEKHVGETSNRAPVTVSVRVRDSRRKIQS